MNQVEVDIQQLLLPGEYLYNHSIYGTWKTLIYPLETRFWVVEVVPDLLMLGTVYELRPEGIFTGDSTALELPTPRPPAGYRSDKFTLAVPSSFYDGQLIVLADETDGEGAVKITLLPSIVRQDDGDCIVLRMYARVQVRAQNSDGFEVDQYETEEWWRHGTGVVRRLDISPQPATMELVARRSLP